VKVIKVSDHVHEKLVELAEKRGLSINQLVEEILNTYLYGVSGDKGIKKFLDKDIVLQYETKCRRCGKELKVGEIAHYVRYEYEDNTSRTFIYCLDCWYSSSALAKQYLTKRKLELTIRGLRQEADKLTQEITRLTQELEQLKIDLDTRRALLKIREELEFLLSMQLISREDYFKMLNKIEELLLRIEELEKHTRLVKETTKVEKKKKY
jgi:Ribbon-helix-helix protein, copG family.